MLREVPATTHAEHAEQASTTWPQAGRQCAREGYAGSPSLEGRQGAEDLSSRCWVYHGLVSNRQRVGVWALGLRVWGLLRELCSGEGPMQKVCVLGFDFEGLLISETVGGL